VLASFFLPPAFANEVTLLDKVVVIVGEGVVTESELRKEVFLASNNIKNSGASMPDITYLRGQVLERMVIRRALGDFADNTGIRVSDNEIREALQRLAQQQNLSVSDYLQAVEDNGLSISQLRESLVIETKILKLRRREIEANLVVNESEIESYLKRVKGGG
jgi:peptidyl-prolyl cis-trans isomerase SurA